MLVGAGGGGRGGLGPMMCCSRCVWGCQGWWAGRQHQQHEQEEVGVDSRQLRAAGCSHGCVCCGRPVLERCCLPTGFLPQPVLLPSASTPCRLLTVTLSSTLPAPSACWCMPGPSTSWTHASAAARASSQQTTSAGGSCRPAAARQRGNRGCRCCWHEYRRARIWCRCVSGQRLQLLPHTAGA